VKYPDEWAFSSYNIYAETKNQTPEKPAVLELFGNEVGFKKFHSTPIDNNLLLDLEL
jgi:hypothetical protein